MDLKCKHCVPRDLMQRENCGNCYNPISVQCHEYLEEVKRVETRKKYDEFMRSRESTIGI